jgi:hypothetical protein
VTEPDSRVTYSVKDLLASVDRRLEAILSKLDSKADLSMVVDLKDRIASLERNRDEQEAVNRARGVSFSKREKILGAAVAAASVAIQVAGHIGGHHL